MNGFYSWSLPLGSVAGIQLRVHWTLLLFWGWRLNSVLEVAPVEYKRHFVLAWLFSVILLFLSILLHEFGHAFAARWTGGDAEEILLWPLGGLAFCRCPNTWKSHLIVAAAGPAVSALIAGLSYGAFFLADEFFPPEEWTSFTALLLRHHAKDMLVNWNFIILVFNLVPLFPLDGGRILHSGLWGYFSWKGRHGWGGAWGGYARASQVTLLVSRITAIGGIAYGVWSQNMWIVIIFVWALMGTESLKR